MYNNSTLVINFFAPPSAGKSTLAAGLFFEMKHGGYKVELVSEYAKDLVYEEANMSNEMRMLAEQDHRQRRLVGKVDYILTDAPLLKSAFYVKGIYDTAHYLEHIRELFNSYNNFNVWVHRVRPYATYGRIQTEEESDEIGQRMLDSVRDKIHVFVDGDRSAPSKVLKALREQANVSY